MSHFSLNCNIFVFVNINFFKFGGKKNLIKFRKEKTKLKTGNLQKIVFTSMLGS